MNTRSDRYCLILVDSSAEEMEWLLASHSILTLPSLLHIDLFQIYNSSNFDHLLIEAKALKELESSQKAYYQEA